MNEQTSETKTIQKIVLNHQPSGGKEWVAKIEGKDPKYGLQRTFLRYGEANWSGSGKTGSTTFFIDEDGIYEYNSPWGGRGFVEVLNGEKKRITSEEVQIKVSSK